MTDVPVDDPDTLRRILANTEGLLLDFDGPICSVFAGFPAHVVASQLRDILKESGHYKLPSEVTASSDPFDVLKYAATLDDKVGNHVEAAFRAHEVEAISTASPTPGAHDLIHAWATTERPVAIVSNNSTVAIESYLNLHQLHHQISHIAARTSSAIALLKPAPYLVTQAVTAIHKSPPKCTLVGDSITDITAAHSANVHTIGYANKPSKAVSFRSSRTHAIVRSMYILAREVIEIANDFQPGLVEPE